MLADRGQVTLGVEIAPAVRADVQYRVELAVAALHVPQHPQHQVAVVARDLVPERVDEAGCRRGLRLARYAAHSSYVQMIPRPIAIPIPTSAADSWLAVSGVRIRAMLIGSDMRRLNGASVLSVSL